MNGRVISQQKRRKAILSAAAAIFQEKGFSRTNIDDIAANVNTSKATIYKYFNSKEELFREAISEEWKSQTDTLLGEFNGDGSFYAQLRKHAKAYLHLMLSPKIIQNRRVTIAESKNVSSGKEYYETSHLPSHRRLADIFEKQMNAGFLLRGDPFIAAKTFTILVDGGVTNLLLTNSIDPLSDDQIDQIADTGVDAFLRCYHPMLSALPIE
ncbi:MAG: TetR/AcrR family transcriptional regulator [Sulfuritalea sp.]|nr:TetR/AcrR family transcriptional regulator [Sulfuritalea sp.]